MLRIAFIEPKNSTQCDTVTGIVMAFDNNTQTVTVFAGMRCDQMKTIAQNRLLRIDTFASGENIELHFETGVDITDRVEVFGTLLVYKSNGQMQHQDIRNLVTVKYFNDTEEA